MEDVSDLFENVESLPNEVFEEDELLQEGNQDGDEYDGNVQEGNQDGNEYDGNDQEDEDEDEDEDENENKDDDDVDEDENKDEEDGDDEEEDDLDTSWIETETFRQTYEREPIKEVVFFFIYMNAQMSIENIIKEYVEVDDNSISKEKLLHFIQTKRHRADGSVGKKYKLADLLAFHVPLEPGELEDFIRGNSISSPSLKPLPIFESVSIEPSIFIFHDLNSLFFFFKQVEKPIKSIMKNGVNTVTKKVRIDTGNYLEKKRKSMKRMMRNARKTHKMSV